MLRRRAQLRQWPLEVPATRQGCSKDRQEAQTLPLLCVMHHRCTKKKKNAQTASKIAVQGQTAVRSFAVSSTRDKRLGRTTSSTTTSGNLQRAFHSPRQRAVTQHKRESRGKASGRQRNVSRACQLPLFCWVVFMSRALSLASLPSFYVLLITECRGTKTTARAKRTACGVHSVCG